jgi:hypothetical protein
MPARSFRQQVKRIVLRKEREVIADTITRMRDTGRRNAVSMPVLHRQYLQLT